MIIPNGTIEFKVIEASGIDPNTGYPIRAKAAEWTSQTECQYLANTYNATALNGGEHHTAKSYVIYIDGLSKLVSSHIRLKDGDGEVLGEFAIKQIEPLLAVNQTRIYV